MVHRIDLEPHERLIINGLTLRNGARRADLLIETECAFMRESELLRADGVKTPAERLCHTLQTLYLFKATPEVKTLFAVQAKDMLQQAPWSAAAIQLICAALAKPDYADALDQARKLVLHATRRAAGAPKVVWADGSRPDSPSNFAAKSAPETSTAQTTSPAQTTAPAG